MLLDTIHSREDLLAVPEQQLPALCEEIRQFLVQNVSRTGGHLASNLGIVETTVACSIPAVTGWCSTSATSATSIRC